MYINVYKGDDNFVTSGTTLRSDLDLQETYKATDSVATGRKPSLFCAIMDLNYFTVSSSSLARPHVIEV